MKWATAALAFVLIHGCAWVSDATIQDARRMVQAGGVLIDVRTETEFTDEHAAGAIHIPVNELPDRHGELRGCPAVVVYCHSGIRSSWAARLLRARGHHVVDLGHLGHAKEAIAGLPERRPTCLKRPKTRQ